MLQCDPSVCPSVHLSVCPNAVAHKRCILCYRYYRPLIGSRCWKSNPLVSVAEWQPEVAETATKLSPVLIQKHTLGGCTTIDILTSNCRRRGACSFATRCLVKNLLPSVDVEEFLKRVSIRRTDSQYGAPFTVN